MAVLDTIKLLNDDDSLELFKETMRSVTLVQLRNNKRGLSRQSACSAQRLSEALACQLDPMDLSGKNVDFTKVISTIEEVVSLLKQEGADDD